MSDAVGHALEEKEKCEEKLKERGWVPKKLWPGSSSNNVRVWTKPGVQEEPLWLADAMEAEFPQCGVHELLHRLWSKAVGTSDYVKSDWLKLEAEVLKLERIQRAQRR